MNPGVSGDWIVPLRPVSEPRARLFCVPFAGGGTFAFRGWEGVLPADVEVSVILPPGRDRRLAEPPIDNADDMATAAAAALQSKLDRPFALFGHSMGAIVGFEIARRLRRDSQTTPSHLFVSGHRAPRRPYPLPSVRDLSVEEFRRVLSSFNGTPKEVLDSLELLQMMLPALRADFAVCETYRYREGPRLPCPITVLSGRSDPDVTPESVADWRHETTGVCEERWFDGDHFYLHAQRAELLATLAEKL